MARELVTKIAERPVDVEPYRLNDGSVVFRAMERGSPIPLYVRSASRRPVCELCDPAHFMFAFDGEGRARGFSPIHITKYGNEEWTEHDVRFLEGRIKGRRIKDLSFDSRVDAVSRATMSSAIIFDEIRRAAELLSQLPGS
jgi:hypothetical protein